MRTVLTERDIEDAIDKGEVKSLIHHLENVIIQKALVKVRRNKMRIRRRLFWLKSFFCLS